jgi:glutamate-1-semialdehyde 2,1-aminomutase
MPPTKEGTILQRAARVLAGGPGTFSKHWSRSPLPFAPDAIVSGKGCYVLGSNGRTYLDTVSSLGANLLGYGHPAVEDAILDQLAAGTSFSCLHPLEVDVAEVLCAVLPCAEMVRFARNGTDVTSMAVRLARAITGHQHAIFVGYPGGGMDSYAITTDRPAGVLSQLIPYNHQTIWDDLSGVPRHAFDDLAIIMAEVPSLPWDAGNEAVFKTLTRYKHVAHAHGALFVLDEIVTFPRYALGGAQTTYGVTPDLCTVSKALANGLPLAALCGRRQHMERLDRGDVFASSTFAGETTALAAARAVITTLRTTDALACLHHQGAVLGAGLLRLLGHYALPASLLGNAARLAVRWHDVTAPRTGTGWSPDNPMGVVIDGARPLLATALELRTLWLAEMARRGILWGIGVCFPQCCWTDGETQKILTAAEDVCALMAQALATGRVQEALPCAVIQDVLAVRA